MSSKGSLASMASFSTNSFENSPHDGKSKSRLSETLFRANPWAPTPQPNLAKPKISVTHAKQSISGPYNFTHITQVNPLDAARLRHGQELGEEWNRALHRESQSRPGTAQTYMPNHVRNDSVATFDSYRSQSRSRSNSTKSLSRPESHVDSIPTSPEPMPTTPPLQSSRQCLRIAEHPEEEFPAQSQGNAYDDEDEGIAPDEMPSTRNTVSSFDDNCFGQKSTGSDRGSDYFEQNSHVPAIRETQSTPDLTEGDRGEEEDTVYMPQMYLSVRPRPMSQLSHASDTLNGAFHVPPSPNVGQNSRRSRRISQRLSTHLRLHGGFPTDGDIDSWEQDIDWCYENEAEDDCDFDWVKEEEEGEEEEATNVEASAIDLDEELDIIQPLSPRPRSPQPVAEPSVVPTELQGIPEEPKEELVVERRITGIFEDRLLLPPSPRFAPSSFGFPGSQRARDSGFESTHSNDESYMSRASSVSMRHRSIATSPSLPDLVPGRPYREELCRVAKQLDEHIAALNAECCYYPTSSLARTLSSHPKRTSSISSNTRPFSGTRSRASSQVTCVTLCSDTDTITPIETHEIITPSSSAHNSFQFIKQRAASVTGAGYAVEGRLEKGLSFPAAAIPGVVEVGPDSLHGVLPEEAEFVHYI